MREKSTPKPRAKKAEPKPLDLTVSLTPDDRVRRHPYYPEFLRYLFGDLLGDPPPASNEALALPETAEGATPKE